MLIRGLPLYTGIAPVVAVSVAYWLGVSNDVLPACLPVLDGCTSISATGRYPPGSFLFRAILLPQAVVLALLWALSAGWLNALTRTEGSNRLLLVSGLLGALALVLYVTFLGTTLPSALLMQGYFVVLYLAWRHTGFTTSVGVR